MSDQRVAVIENGTVINVIIADDEYDMPGFVLVRSDVARKGDTWDGTSFIAPEAPPAPLPPIDAWRFEAAIELAGIKSAIDAAIDGLDEPDRTVAKAKRARVQQYHRDDPLIALLAPVLNLTDEGVDTLWRTAMAF